MHIHTEYIAGCLEKTRVTKGSETVSESVMQTFVDCAEEKL